jgi:hypothetical protein
MPVPDTNVTDPVAASTRNVDEVVSATILPNAKVGGASKATTSVSLSAGCATNVAAMTKSGKVRICASWRLSASPTIPHKGG